MLECYFSNLVELFLYNMSSSLTDKSYWTFHSTLCPFLLLSSDLLSTFCRDSLQKWSQWQKVGTKKCLRYKRRNQQKVEWLSRRSTIGRIITFCLFDLLCFIDSFNNVWSILTFFLFFFFLFFLDILFPL